MRQLVDVLRRKHETGLAVLLITAADGKVQLVAGLSKDLIERGLHAGNWLKEVAPVVGGGGGGRPDLAQAGGKSPEKIPAALEQALKAITSRLSLESVMASEQRKLRIRVRLSAGQRKSRSLTSTVVDVFRSTRAYHGHVDEITRFLLEHGGSASWSTWSRKLSDEASPPCPPPFHEPATVLVVDDSAFDRHLIGQLLQSLKTSSWSSPRPARKGSNRSSARNRP